MSDKDTVTVTVHLTDFPEDMDSVEVRTLAAGVTPFILIEPGDGDEGEYEFNVTNSVSTIESTVAVLELVTKSLKEHLEEKVAEA